MAPDIFRIIAITVIATFILAWLLNKKIAGWQISKNRKQGKKGEADALKWLQKHGFKNIKEQVQIAFTWSAGAKIITSKIRPDVLAQKDGVEWLIEVKTGNAASLKNTKTRRQLREYAALFPDKKCALFDASKNKFYEIDFDFNNLNHHHKYRSLVSAFLYGASIGVIVAWVLFKFYN